MRYSAEQRFGKYVKGYGFLSFARKFGNKYIKKLKGTAKKNRNRCKPKVKEKTKEIEEIYISPEKGQQVIDDLRLFWA